VQQIATELLQAFAVSDLDAIARLCADDMLLVGTDEGEYWEGLEAVLASFGGAYDLQVEWVGEPQARGNWVFGRAEFTEEDGSKLPVRVTMVFAGEKLVHAHYSVVREVS
jgi:ketosteroid isomerase-like protein